MYKCTFTYVLGHPDKLGIYFSSTYQDNSNLNLVVLLIQKMYAFDVNIGIFM
jgi:hypothetical protein